MALLPDWLTDASTSPGSRYTRPNLGTLVNQITIDDPGAYSRPFTVTFTANLAVGMELLEYICNENSQDVEHLQGPTQAPGDPARPLGVLAPLP